jgi:hypothetical protein
MGTTRLAPQRIRVRVEHAAMPRDSVGGEADRLAHLSAAENL